MIPKIIHYVWLGGKPLTEMGEKCLASWKKFCPEYEIMRWDENNFDINSNQYVLDAYNAKKFAFASDYIRLYAMVKHGGVYMDTDVEVLKSLDQFLEHQAFSGFERPQQIPTGIMACEEDFPLFKELLKEYETRKFINEDGSFNTTTNVRYITDKCLEKGLVLNNIKQDVDGFILYPTDYFCPKDYETKQLNLTENTATIHHFDGSWLSKAAKKEMYLKAKYQKKYGKNWKIPFAIAHPILSIKISKRSKGENTK